MVKYSSAILLFLYGIILFAIPTHAQVKKVTFSVIPLGVKGGSDESNLSAYMVSPVASPNYICLDAGTLHAGIQKSIEKGALKGSINGVLKNNITAYFISHPHLDHLAGMIINSPDDSIKPIYGLPFCLNTIKEKYFSWKSWANFGDAGEEPRLNKYQYKEMKPGNPVPVAGTEMEVTAFLLSHSSPYQSTAFLVRYKEEYLLYLGDTGADAIEKSTQLQQLWSVIGPLIRSKKLKAIFIEVSFANEQKKELLFGHLTPALLMQEMKTLARIAGEGSMKDFNVVITHQKPGANRETKIKVELEKENPLGLRLIFPHQGETLFF